MMTVKDSHNAPTPELAVHLLHVVQEISTTLYQIREETPLLVEVLSRLTAGFGLPYGTIFLQTGESLDPVAIASADPTHPLPFQQAASGLAALLRDLPATDVHVLTDLASLFPTETADNGRPPLRLVAIAPLPSRGAPMGAIVLGTQDASLPQPAALDGLRVVSHLLASSLRETRLKGELDTATKRLSLESKKESQSTDKLTGLPNRQVFDGEIQRLVKLAVETGGHLSLLTIDADHFTALNASYGIEFGDEVLRRIAKSILASVRGGDVAARYGDDEFRVLLPSTPGIGAVVVAERLHERISTMTFDSPEGPWNPTVSIGVACLSRRVTTSDDLMEKTYIGILQARSMGGNQVIFDWDEALENMDEE